MTSAISETLTFLFSNDVKTILIRIKKRDVPALVQFAAYATCGVMATVMHNGLVILLSYFVFPAVKNLMVDGVVLDELVRKHNLILNNTIAFPFGCVVAYLTNIMFVFSPGKHNRMMEMLLFFGVAAVAFFPSLWIIDILLIKYPWLPSTVAQLAFVFTSFLVNFFMRKFVIFKG